MGRYGGAYYVLVIGHELVGFPADPNDPCGQWVKRRKISSEIKNARGSPVVQPAGLGKILRKDDG